VIGGGGQEPADNVELLRLHDEDQADRLPAHGGDINWSVVGPRDAARLARVKELFADGAIRTATDYYRAAMVLQHGPEPEDFLLAHEFCVVALTLGKNDKETRWLAASSEDRFLMNINRPQRFGTQFHSASGGPWQLYNVDPTLTDEVRQLMGTRTLAEARAHEAELNRE
jgi:hypothetical protein